MENPISVKLMPDGLMLFDISPEIIDKNFSEANASNKRYYFGLTCSWHGYHTRPWCPKCGGMMQPLPESEFWRSAIAADQHLKVNGAWIHVCQWTTEKCFPDFETCIQIYNSINGTKYKPQEFVPF